MNAPAPRTKLSAVVDAMRADDWHQAIRLAAKFPDLGKQRCAILDAHTAITNPSFMRQLRRDPEAVIEAGKQALRQRYASTPS